VVRFSFGSGHSISGFLCFLIVNQNNDAPTAPAVTEGGTPILPTGGGGW
jgi:hypothetical protein